MRLPINCFGLVLLFAVATNGAAQGFIQDPDIHGDKVAFSSGGDIWVGSVQDRSVKRITAADGDERNPRFSPDGTSIAFTGHLDGSRSQVYTIPAEGGSPHRVTYDPVGAEMVCWTPDGKRILFRSNRETPFIGPRLYSVSVDGGPATTLRIAKAAQASFSPDGRLLAYCKFGPESNHWKQYHGGQANAIWITDLGGSFKRIDDSVYAEQFPAWSGGQIFFVSERDGSANLWCYDVSSRKCSKITSHSGFDVASPCTDGKRVIYQFGYQLWLYDPQSGTDQPLSLNLPGEKIHAKPRTIRGSVEAFALNPSGDALTLECRGQLFEIPIAGGQTHPILEGSGSQVHDFAWSPDGKFLEYVSDSGGEDNIWLQPSGGGPAMRATSEHGAPIEAAQWSPDSRTIVYSDYRQNIYLFDVVSARKTLVATSGFGVPKSFAFSPDSKWLAFCKNEDLFRSSMYLYDIEHIKLTCISNPAMRDYDPVFDPTGRYLYFRSDRSLATQDDGYDDATDMLNTGMLFGLTLQKETPVPAASGSLPVSLSASSPVRIDLEGIADRIFDLPAPPGEIQHRSLAAIMGGLLCVSRVRGTNTLFLIDMQSMTVKPLGQGVSKYALSPDNRRLGVMGNGGLRVVDAGQPIAPESKPIDLTAWQVSIDPAAEWQEIFERAWRNQRDLFYDPNLHRQDWESVHSRYSALVPLLGCREELNELIGQMIGEMNVSHEFVGGGDDGYEPASAPGVAAIGADIEWDSQTGLYRVTRVLENDGYDLYYRSPLRTPGVNLKEGSYLFEIDGTKLSPSEDPYKLLLGKAGVDVRLLVNDVPSEAGARSITIKAVGNDIYERYIDWVVRRRQLVDLLGKGRIAYIHLPNMRGDGIGEFSKIFYASLLNKDGLIIDVRYNAGGRVSGQILERLMRSAFAYRQNRYVGPYPYPEMTFPGRIVVLCNERTNSDGELFCAGFKSMKLGSTVGTRTWGGFVAEADFDAVDGGFVSTPINAFYTPAGQWMPDGTGFVPDFEAAEDQNDIGHGTDAQLQRAVKVLQRMISDAPPLRPKKIPYPVDKKLRVSSGHSPTGQTRG